MTLDPSSEAGNSNRRFNQTAEIKAVTYRHGPKKLLGELEQVILLRLIISTPGIYLSEIESKLFSMIVYLACMLAYLYNL